MKKEIKITDEEKIQKKTMLDLHEHGEFEIEDAFLDPETYEFRLIGVWSHAEKERKAEITGRLNPEIFDTPTPWKRELEMTLSDITDVEWVEWDIEEI